MPADEHIQEYRRTLAAAAPPFVRPRRFIGAESWAKATTQEGTRYLGLFREHEPDLPAVLTHKQVLILGEPGAGKSTTTRAVVQHVLDQEQLTEIPVPASLKSYNGNLRQLLLRTTPAEVLDTRGLTRTYILDGIDEIPINHREALPREINDLLTADASARIVLTSRQAFYAQHPDAFPEGLAAYHLLDFDDADIRACARQRGVDADAFLTAVRDVDCEDEIRNPFVLDVMLKRHHEQGRLNPRRSDNVRYVVDQLIQSRPTFSTVLQRRALKMLATACETAARNELSEKEALRVLLEAIEFSQETARQLLDELSQSILIRTAGGISFQMRSYGEYLAAEELHDKPVDRLKELAFLGDTPVDTWLNAVTYLAEMNDRVRQYFARRQPEWLVNVSPAAFTDDERTTLTGQLLHDINQSQTYLVNQKAISLRRLSRLLTPTVIAHLRTQLTSTQPREVANALALLGVLGQADIVPQALRLATEHRSESPLRYSAIIALINADDNSVINDLIAFADHSDTYYIHIIDTIGSLCTPTDFPRVLPLLESTSAGLSSAFYHFRELISREALTAAIDYLTRNPATLSGYDLDSYLEPIIDLIPTHWDDSNRWRPSACCSPPLNGHDSSTAREARPRTSSSTSPPRDQHAIAIPAMVTSLATDDTRLRYTDHLIAPLITTQAAQWINENAPSTPKTSSRGSPPGTSTRPPRPHQSPELSEAQEEARTRISRNNGSTSKRPHHDKNATPEHHPAPPQTSTAIIGACERLQRTLARNLVQSNATGSHNSNRHPRSASTSHTASPGKATTDGPTPGPPPLLKLTDYYHLRLIE